MMRGSMRVMLAALLAMGALGAAAQEATPEVTPEAPAPMMQMGPAPFVGVRLAADDTGAIVVEAVTEGSPAEAAGIQVGDVITGFNGVEVAAIEDVVLLVREQAVGDAVTLDIERNGDPMTIALTLAEMPADVALDNMGRGNRGGQGNNNNDGQGGNRGGQGNNNDGQGNMPNMDDMMDGMMNGMFANPDLMLMMLSGAGRLGVAFEVVDESSIIREVAEGSPAAEAGLQVDDVISAVNGEVVDAERTLRDRIFAYEPGDVVTLTVQRGSETLEIEVTLGEQQGMMMQDGSSMMRRDGQGRFFFELPVPPAAPEATPEPTPNA